MKFVGSFLCGLLVIAVAVQLMAQPPIKTIIDDAQECQDSYRIVRYIVGKVPAGATDVKFTSHRDPYRSQHTTSNHP